MLIIDVRMPDHVCSDGRRFLLVLLVSNFFLLFLDVCGFFGTLLDSLELHHV